MKEPVYLFAFIPAQVLCSIWGHLSLLVIVSQGVQLDDGK